MVKQLRKRLIAAYVLATGLLLSIIVTGLLILSFKQYETNNISRFQSAFGNVVDAIIKAGSKISYTVLAESEINENLIIAVYSNTIPISFKGSWKPETDRDKLLEKLNNIVLNDESLINISKTVQGEVRSPIYSIYGEQGEHYYGSVYFKKTFSDECKILVLKALNGEKEVFVQSAALYLSINIAGIAVLFFICRTFVNHSLKPLEVGLKRQNEFIAAASHELRAPLTVIRAGIHAVSLDESKAKQFLPSIEKEGERMTALIDDMLQLALADANTWTLHKEPISPDTLLITIYDTLSALCRKKKQLLEVKLQDEEIPAFLADRERIEQVIMILTDNASSYSPEGSKVSVNAWSDQKHVFIEVEDHGCGIKEEDKKRIFDRFYRLDKSRNDKSHYGLGLSIAMELVRLHHGRLYVKDTVGGGSTFVLEFSIFTP